ncbi:glycine C-acetyltransferase [Candidatus Kapabacteria bacterium]|nr:glycine C-acetyltransferase [Candidatus Kapabacteria bacterium]
MYTKMKQFLKSEITSLHDQNLYKHERVIESEQGPEITVSGKQVLNFCANNYLGLSSHPDLVKAAHDEIDKRGFGLSSVRFICGTQDDHLLLEKKMSEFFGADDTILFCSAFDANGAFFEPLFGKEDAIITDSLNHASIIDGIRLSKAQRWIFNHGDMSGTESLDKSTGKTLKGLEKCLQEAKDCRFKVIVTDGVFSMDGDIAKLDEICDLADKYDALVFVDECHASGFMGKTGRGTHEHFNVMDRVDVISTTFGKALGGASGGCLSGKKEIIEWLRNKARPYLFSNTLAPAVVGATLKCLEILTESTTLRDTLMDNTKYFREKMNLLGFDIIPGIHPITPVMFRNFDNSSALAVKFADRMLEEGIYVIAFSFPVVPRKMDRIRVQISAAHSREQIDKCISAFEMIGKELNVIS